jgi:carbonic anhydrase
MIDRCSEALNELLAGNARFREGRSENKNYTLEELEGLTEGQSPIAAVIGCSDSRTAPEIIMDQPLGQLFVCRPPGAVASEGAKWMVELAVTELNIPVVMVLGHSGCYAVKQIVEGELTGPGGLLRVSIANAVSQVKSRGYEDLYLESVIENTRQTAETLKKESAALRNAIREGRTQVVSALYEMETGTVALLEDPAQDQLF